MTPSANDVTKLLLDWSNGHQEALEQLMPLVYNELRRLAEHHLQRERPDHTLSATALVHEAYLRLVDQTHVRWQNRAQFFGIAAHLRPAPWVARHACSGSLRIRLYRPTDGSIMRSFRWTVSAAFGAEPRAALVKAGCATAHGAGQGYTNRVVE